MTPAVTSAGKVDAASVVVALLLAALAGIVGWNASTIASNNVYGVGPSAVPYLIACGLGILAIGHLVSAFRGKLPPREPADARSILLILGGLAALIGIIGIGGGFILATAALFACTATAFGRRAYIADAAIGLGLGTLIFLGFDRILSLSLPAGPIERFLVSLGRLF